MEKQQRSRKPGYKRGVSQAVVKKNKEKKKANILLGCLNKNSLLQGCCCCTQAPEKLCLKVATSFGHTATGQRGSAAWKTQTWWTQPDVWVV